MYKHIIFDFDGTLIDSNNLINKALRETSIMVLGKEITQEKINEVWGKVLVEQMADLDEFKVDQLSDYYRMYYRKHRDEHTTIFDGILEMLNDISKLGCSMSIITNKGSSGLDHGLELFNIKHHFEIALSKSDVDKKKPDPEGVFKILKHFNAKKSEVLFIGDSIHDILCGKNAGIDTALVKWTVIDLDTLLKEKPTYLIEKPNDLIKIILHGAL